ncbi:MAG: GntR family transcriptional regulator [Pirellulales bacterium]
MLTALPRRKIRDVVALRLKSYIVERRLKPGDRLPTETALAKQFGVSRLSLREATKALEFIGAVEAKPGVGLTVGQVDFERVAEHLGFHPALREGSPAELIDTRIVVETGILPYVMRRMADDRSIYDSLAEINQRLRQARTLAGWIELDIAFHRCLIASSGLLPLLAFNDLLAVFFQQFRESVKKAEWQTGIDSHQRIIDALKAQQLAAACDELQTHILSHKRRMGV